MLSIIRKSYNYRNVSVKYLSTSINYDINYYCNEKNTGEIKHNISIRKGVGDIEAVLNLFMLYNLNSSDTSTKNMLLKELSILPNKTHPAVIHNSDPVVRHVLNERRTFNHKPFEFSEITHRLNLLRTEKLGNTCGHKSYYLLGELAELEEALIQYTVTNLIKRNFQLVSVPDILPKNVLESCGMIVNNDRTQVYSLDPHHHGTDLYLSGTAEMSLAGLLMNTSFNKESLPLKLAAVSRCYRAETSNVVEERGIYRVHQFTKVEMFAVTTPEQSDEMLEYILKTQEELFQPLGLHMQVLDMPPYELGAPAYRKYDIEAWMPGRDTFGELSSCSNCTDYQSRRLDIQYHHNGGKQYAHTLNGTACAVPRMLIALFETHQHPKGKILIPEVLQPFMNGKESIGKCKAIPELKLLKIKR